MDYLEIEIAVHPQAVEAMADLLRHYAPSGISIEPRFEATDEEGGVGMRDDAPARLRAWLPAGALSRSSVEALRRELNVIDPGIAASLRASTIQEASWADAWKEHFHVLRVGERIVLRPSWRKYTPEPGDVVVELEPGRAFGTGQHETTRLCLVELERRIQPGMAVLDVGSGSGILAVAAALLGAARVDAVDIDAAAVAATQENAGRNGVTDIVRAACGSLGEGWPFEAPPDARYDLVLANLSARLVREMASDLLYALAPAGSAVVSGMVAEQEASCVGALVQAGAAAIEHAADGDWRLLAVSR